MDEDQLGELERALHRAPAGVAASVAFAALVRLGELENEGSAAFHEHLRLAAAHPDLLEKAMIGIDGLT